MDEDTPFITCLLEKWTRSVAEGQSVALCAQAHLGNQRTRANVPQRRTVFVRQRSDSELGRLGDRRRCARTVGSFLISRTILNRRERVET
jgi:hypothetical protein